MQHLTKLYNYLPNAMLVPIPRASKAPKLKGWQNASFSEADFAEDSNVGLRFDSSYFAIDIDTEQAEQAWRAMLEEAMYAEEISAHVAWTSDKASYKKQILFKRPADFALTSRCARNGLELRTGSTQSVLPPSIHPDTNKPYRWLISPWASGACIDEPPPELTHELVSYFAKLSKPKRVVTSEGEATARAWVWAEANTVARQLRAFNGESFDGLHQHRSDFIKAKASRLFRYEEGLQYANDFEQAVLDNGYFLPKHHAQVQSLIDWSSKLCDGEVPHYSHIASRIAQLTEQEPSLKQEALEQLKAMWYECDKSEFIMQIAKSLC